MFLPAETFIMDVEQAPNCHSGIKAYQLPTAADPPIMADEGNQLPTAVDFERIKNIEAKKVIILSFRSLQLRRITELQDKLLGLAAITASGAALSNNHQNDVDKALRDYGKFI